MENEMLKILQDLDNCIGVSGDEAEVAEVIDAAMEGLYDEVSEDALGTRYYTKYGKNRDTRILYAAHMDEIGFIVNYIEDNGFIRFLPVGYHDDSMAINQELVIRTEAGKHVYGITGAKPRHLMDKNELDHTIPIEDLFMDIGADSREEAIRMGVNVGDYVAFARKGRQLNEGRYYTGKSVDNRAGCAVLIELMRRFAYRKPENTVVVAFSVQEEVGLRSGSPMMHNMDPDVMIAIDVTMTGDTPGIEKKHSSQELGKGPSINFYDWDPELGGMGNNVPRKLTRAIINAAEKEGIPFQRDVVMGGGTDAWSAAFAGKGYLAGGISIPERYMHTAVGTVCLEDMVNTVRLLQAFADNYKSV